MSVQFETGAKVLQYASKVFLLLLFVGGVSLPPLVIYLSSDNIGSAKPTISTPSSNCSDCLDNRSSSSAVNNSFSQAKKDTTESLRELRKSFQNTSLVTEPIQAYIVTNNGAHQSGSAAGDRRREYISGFTGSAGTAIVTELHAGLWTDGRYFLQAENQLDSNWVLVRDGLPDSPTFGQWLKEKLPPSSVVGADPNTMSCTAWDTLSGDLLAAGHRLVPVAHNLVDLVWKDRPAPPTGSVCVLDLEFTGVDWKEKIASVRLKMTEKKADFLVVTALDEVAWLLNLRGSDTQYSPIFFAYVIVAKDSVILFLNDNKLTPAVRAHLSTADTTDMKVELLPYNKIFQKIDEITKADSSRKIWVSSESSYAACSRVPTGARILAASPIALMKSTKNAAEINGMINGHVRDGAALAEFLAWMEREVPNGGVTELSASAMLEEMRSRHKNYFSLSFPVIAGSGPNGAIVHYRPTPETNRAVTINDMFLLDSGGQYLDATTDVTRTVHFGQPTDYQKECYTMVLKGNLALAMAKFPVKTTGHRLDSIARHVLWSVGLDYGHGTGHGVGSFLGVHEGPISIASRPTPSDPGLLAGMVVSDEPGYYEEGSFGIRLETQMLVEPVETKHGKSGEFLQLRYLTLAPFHRKLIALDLLTKDEIDYIDRYHADCLLRVGNLLKELGKTDAYAWLEKETTPLR